MSVVKKGASALGKLFVLVALAATFVVGLVGVVYMSLQGQEMKVPEIVGKDLSQSEQELAALGLRIKNRASRYSTEKPNTVLEQIPKAGETVKSGQMIFVVTSKTNPEGEEAPATIKKSGDEDDTQKIEDLISDKPKKSNKTNANSNSNKKKTSTTRDVLSSNSNSNSANSNSNSTSGNSTKDNKNASTNSNKNSNAADAKKPSDAKPAPAKTPAKPATNGGDVRPRKTP